MLSVLMPMLSLQSPMWPQRTSRFLTAEPSGNVSLLEQQTLHLMMCMNKCKDVRWCTLRGNAWELPWVLKAKKFSADMILTKIQYENLVKC